MLKRYLVGVTDAREEMGTKNMGAGHRRDINPGRSNTVTCR